LWISQRFFSDFRKRFRTYPHFCDKKKHKGKDSLSNLKKTRKSRKKGAGKEKSGL
jgi:hypothetical protein